jgi:hypothetical protein
MRRTLNQRTSNRGSTGFTFVGISLISQRFRNSYPSGSTQLQTYLTLTVALQPSIIGFLFITIVRAWTRYKASTQGNLLSLSQYSHHKDILQRNWKNMKMTCLKVFVHFVSQ